MRQTLFYIPHFLFEGPLFWGWIITGIAILAYLFWRHGWGNETISFLPIFVIVAIVIRFVLPALEVTDFVAGDPTEGEQAVGLAIRGYGLMLLLALIAGVGVSIYRANKLGIHPDRMISFSFWAVVSGIVGARLFYVIQKWDQFSGAESSMEWLGSILNLTQGGLVVYGSIIGGAIGGIIYMWRSRMPIPQVADIIAPGIMLGLAIGRVGCLMNGCCYGGTCEIDQIAQRFPAGSPPYLRQLETGELLGIASRTESTIDANGNPIKILIADEIARDSMAEKSGVQNGQPFRVMFPSDNMDKVFRAIKQRDLDLQSSILIESGGNQTAISVSELPEYSMPVYPTQLMSAINAALLAAVLWFYFPFRRREGQVFALLLILYSATRFLLEFVRSDELGLFGTPFTISQWVSIATIAIGIVLFLWLSRLASNDAKLASAHT